MVNGLISEIRANGDRGAVVPFYRVNDLKNDMLDLKNGGYHPCWLNRMANHITDSANRFVPPEITFEPQSLITVVMPGPKLVLKFCYNGRVFDVILPPHYMDWENKNKRALEYISGYLAPYGFSAVTAITLAHKLLAVHSGLGQYGRNNICYNEEFGSYMQIMTYISDLPCAESKWLPLSRMERCDKCHACVSACPTGAIDIGRRLINSDRCITAVNESPGEFPQWLTKDMHNSITGCTKCQDCCPGNIINKNNIVSGAIFDEKETMELLNNKTGAPYTDRLAEKLKGTGISSEFIEQFPRNLSMLIMKS